MKIQIVLVAVLALSLTEMAFAQQPADSFAELASTLKVSDYVQVVDRKGKKVTGKVTSLGRSSLSLSQGTLNFSEADVLTVTRIQRDSKLNGRLIGGAAGAALMLAAVFTGDTYDLDPAVMGGGAGVFGFLVGAWIGGTIDGHHNKHETVYRSTNASTHLFNVKPLVSKQGKGVAVSMRF